MLSLAFYCWCVFFPVFFPCFSFTFSSPFPSFKSMMLDGWSVFGKCVCRKFSYNMLYDFRNSLVLSFFFFTLNLFLRLQYLHQVGASKITNTEKLTTKLCYRSRTGWWCEQMALIRQQLQQWHETWFKMNDYYDVELSHNVIYCQLLAMVIHRAPCITHSM